MNEIVKQFFIFVGCFFVALFINSLFQTACQNLWGVTRGNETRCALTEPLHSALYFLIIVIVALAIYYGIQRLIMRKRPVVKK